LRARARARGVRGARVLTCRPWAGAGLNAQRFPVTTLMIIDEHNHGLPVAHIIHSKSDADTLVQIFNTLRERVGAELCPKFILIDDADTEIAAVRACKWGIDGCKVALCVWHVKRAWLVNLITKVPTKEKHGRRLEMFDALQDIQNILVRGAALRAPQLARR
jgi:hypothetical protein